VKREVKAALALALLILLCGVALWWSETSTPPQAETRAAPSRAPAAAPRTLAPTPAPSSSPGASPVQSQDQPGPEGSPSRPDARAKGAPSEPEEAQASLAPQGAPLEGRVLGPGRLPAQTQVYAFEVGAHLSPDFSDYVDCPLPIQLIATRRSDHRCNHLVTVASDEAGRFSIPRDKIKNHDLLLVAAAEVGTGSLRLAGGAVRGDLILAPWRALRVVVAGRIPSGASLSLQIPGTYSDLSFPEFDAKGATSVRLAASPQELTLVLAAPGWASLERPVTPAEQAAGLVKWTFPTDRVEVRGRVLDPAGGPWRNGFVTLRTSEDLEVSTLAEVKTDDDGVFVGRGFPPGQEVSAAVYGGPKWAYHVVKSQTGAPPLLIRLSKPSVLRVRVEGAKLPRGIDWQLERKDDQGAWQSVSLGSYSRPSRGPDFEGEDGQDRYFSLDSGENTIFGLSPGRYRISLGSFADAEPEAAEVELPPGGTGACTLEVRPRPKTTFRGVMVCPGVDLAKRKASLNYETEDSVVMHTFDLDERGAFELEVLVGQPVKVQVSVPELKLQGRAVLDPAAPDLGTIVLDRP
jgi:hypothetical protein